MSRSVMLPPIRPRPIIARRIALCSGKFEVEKARQIRAKLWRGLKENNVHAERSRRCEILLAVVDEERCLGLSVCDAKRPMIETAHRLSHSQPARGDERLEHLGDPESLDPIDVEVFRFVVEGHQSVTRIPRERLGDADCFLVRYALRAHELPEFLARKVAVGVEDGDVEILVERDTPFFPLSDHFLVAPLEFLGVEPEPLDGALSLLAIPAVGAEYATDVEEDVGDRRHVMRTARAVAPSQPSMRSGRHTS